MGSTVGTVGTAGTAAGIPGTGAPRTSCSNLRWGGGHTGHHQDLLAAPRSQPPSLARSSESGLPRPGSSRHPTPTRALQGHLRLHLLQALLAALAREAGTRARDDGSSCTRESRGRSRPGHCCCRRRRRHYSVRAAAVCCAVYSWPSSESAPGNDLRAKRRAPIYDVYIRVRWPVRRGHTPKGEHEPIRDRREIAGRTRTLSERRESAAVTP